MKRKLGIFLMALGLALLLCAAGLLVYNRWESERAAAASAALMEQLGDHLSQYTPQIQMPPSPLTIPTEPAEMTTLRIDGRDYIGYLSIPSLGLELPILAAWSDAAANIAPCRFSGTTFGSDLVLAGHNFDRHFGQLKNLKPGETVAFVDMDNVATLYQVAVTDVVAPTAVEEVTAGLYDLALVTCTYGGKTRVVVYCDVAS